MTNTVTGLGDEIFGVSDKNKHASSISDPSQPLRGAGQLPIGPGDGDPRFDPRTGQKLVKGKIRHSDGTGFITIDYNPATGGVFLDKGELLALSKVKEVRSTLENLLSQQTL